MRLLQAEDLRHHVVTGRRQQDPSRGQTDHDVTSHRRQAHGDRIRTCTRTNTSLHSSYLQTTVMHYCQLGSPLYDAVYASCPPPLLFFAQPLICLIFSPVVSWILLINEELTLIN